MAYSAIVSLTQTIDEILDHHQFSICLHQKQQIISIKKHAISLLEFLDNFPDKVTNHLACGIMDVATRVEDRIEYFMWKSFHESSLKRTEVGLFTKLRLQLDIKRNVKNELFVEDLGKEFLRVRRDMLDIKNSFGVKDEQLMEMFDATSSPSSGVGPAEKIDMVGFDDDLIALKTRLCGESCKLQLIPIIGMGGIGKTTLARNVYNDPLIVEHFYIHVWITVSQDNGAQRVLSSLKLSLKASNVEDVYRSLKGRRYLIVMDDIWSAGMWNDVKSIFPDDNNGSRIILTTRLLDVATYVASSSSPHHMQFLDEDQSWNLLQQKVFTFPQSCPHELTSIGKVIAKRCRGLPLAIVTIAGVLSTMSESPTSWEKISRNINLAISTNNEQFADTILSLSYNRLPQNLRQCFLYMGAFPEDYEIPVSKLTKIWVAEGFLEPVGSKGLEEVAEECLEALVKRSLVLANKRKYSGKIKSCSVHDLVRDLCIKQATQEKFLVPLTRNNVLPEIPRNIRRVSFAHTEDRLVQLYDSSVRTILCFKNSGRHCLNSLEHFQLLRVLATIDFARHKSLPLVYKIFGLFHLRYLTMDHCRLIPPAIANLKNLQTLIIHPRKSYSRDYIVTFPSEIWMLPRLRHLVSSSYSLPEPGVKNLSLENLQTLSNIEGFRCIRETLNMIPNVKKLGLLYFNNEHLEEYRPDNLVYLDGLEKLRICVLYEDFSLPRTQAFPPYGNPIFPSTLKKLTLRGLNLFCKDVRVVGLLPNLEVLKLRDCAFGCEKWKTSEGEFPQLKLLLIESSDLKQWISESSHFPCLKFLQLSHCWCLNEIPEGFGEIPTLKVIEVDNCNKSLMESVISLQEEQQSWGNDALQIHITHIDGTKYINFNGTTFGIET